jgi:Tol biopolymer transport system component
MNRLPAIALLLAAPAADAEVAELVVASIADDAIAVGVEPMGYARGCSLSRAGGLLTYVSSAFNLLPADTNRSDDGFVLARSSDFLRRLPDANGDQIGGHVRRLVVSGDARWVVLETDVALVPEDGNEHHDVYLHELSSNDLLLVSRTPSGSAGDGPSRAAVISEDGDYVAFESEATDLTATALVDPGTQVYRYERATADVRLVSRRRAALGPGAGDADSREPRISELGQYVAFTSSATDLISGDTNGVDDVFLRDMVANATERASRGPSGSELSGSSRLNDLSDDGRSVLFTTHTDLAPGDTNGLDDLYRVRLDTGTVAWLSRTDTGTARTTGVILGASMSGDDSLIAFASTASDLVAGDFNGESDVFLRSPASGLVRVSNHASGASASGESSEPCLSRDGSTLAFTSAAPDIVAGDLNAGSDVFTCETSACTPARESAAPDVVATPISAYGVVGYPLDSLPAQISRDGQHVLIASPSFNLDLADADGLYTVDLFLRENAFGFLDTPTSTRLVTPGPLQVATSAAMSGDARWIALSAVDVVEPLGTEQVLLFDRVAGGPAILASAQTPGIGLPGTSLGPSLSLDGEWVVFESDAPAPGLVDGNGEFDVLRFRRSTGALDAVSVAANGTAVGDAASAEASVSDDGRWVAFASQATDLIAGETDANSNGDVFLRDMDTATTLRMSRPRSGSSNGKSRRAAITPDGRCVAFESEATNLDAVPPPVARSNVYVYVRGSGLITLLSRRADGTAPQSGDNYELPAISDDCAFVAFVATVSGQSQVVRVERATGTTRVLSVDGDGSPLPSLGYDSLSMSGDGRAIAFVTNDADAVPALDINSYPDAYAIGLVDLLLEDGFETTLP